jgi:hypothetical protein
MASISRYRHWKDFKTQADRILIGDTDVRKNYSQLRVDPSSENFHKSMMWAAGPRPLSNRRRAQTLAFNSWEIRVLLNILLWSLNNILVQTSATQSIESHCDLDGLSMVLLIVAIHDISLHL